MQLQMVIHNTTKYVYLITIYSYFFFLQIFASLAVFAPTQTNLIVSQQSNQTQSYFHQATQNQSLSTNLLFNNNSYNSSSHNLFHSVPGALQSSIICSQCRIIPTVPTVCRTCHRTFCLTCMNDGQNNSCSFCIERFSYSFS
jgi:hypothetical protein